MWKHSIGSCSNDVEKPRVDPLSSQGERNDFESWLTWGEMPVGKKAVCGHKRREGKRRVCLGSHSLVKKFHQVFESWWILETLTYWSIYKAMHGFRGGEGDDCSSNSSLKTYACGVLFEFVLWVRAGWASCQIGESWIATGLGLKRAARWWTNLGMGSTASAASLRHTDSGCVEDWAAILRIAFPSLAPQCHPGFFLSDRSFRIFNLN